jgi:diacylglycerol kinase (ATP)
LCGLRGIRVTPVVMGNLRLAVVVNPRKFDDVDVPRAQIFAQCREAGLDEPLWFEADKKDHGRAKAKKAMKKGATVVAALGGDGTVRGVASAVVGSDVSLGILPGGTGNLLARNLKIPVDDLAEALRIVMRGREHHIDVGRVQFDHDDPEMFLVMTGMGLDGQTMAKANKTVKATLGWPAYVVSGVEGMFRGGFGAKVSTPGQQRVRQHAVSVIVGNCGTLTGGIELMPHARLDDGKLDAVVVSPHGVFGWAAVVAAVASHDKSGHRRLVRRVGHKITVSCDVPVEAQLDGDAVGKRSRIKARVDPSALRVRIQG